MKYNTQPIHFNELKDISDDNAVVLIATTFPEDFNFDELDDFLSNELCFSKGKKLVGVRRILGNIKGNAGRTDWLLEFEGDVFWNVIARLRFPSLKWVSDFIYNYKEDFFDF